MNNKTRINSTPVEEIFDRFTLKIQLFDMELILTDESVREDFRKKRDEGYFDDENLNEKLRAYILEHEKNVDNTELLFRTLYNTILESDNLSFLDKKNVDNIIAAVKGIDYESYRFCKQANGRLRIKITTGKDLVEGRTEVKIDEQKNAEKIADFEKQVLPLEELVKPLLLSDFTTFAKNRELSGFFIYQSIYNRALRTNDNIDKSRKIVDIDEYIENSSNYRMADFMPEFKHILSKYADYINFDHLALDSLYKDFEYLDNNNVGIEEFNEIKNRIEKVYEYLKHKNTKIFIEAGYIDSDRIIYDEYRLKDAKRSLMKLRKDKYMGKATVSQIKKSLFAGTCLLGTLQEGDYEFLNLSDEEKMMLVNLNDENYIYLIKTGNIKKDQIETINNIMQEINPKVVQAMYESQVIDIPEILDLCGKGKTNLDELLAIGVPILENITFEQVYEQCLDKAHIQVYKDLLDKNAEVKELYKSKAIEEYLESLDPSYLEVFINLGVIVKNDLEGVIDENDWVELIEEETISEEFCMTLYKDGFISDETIKNNKKTRHIFIKEWEEGKITTEGFETLNIGTQELLQMCDRGEINGARIRELLHTAEEKEKIKRQTRSAYAYGFYNTIKPGLVCYNNDLIDRDSIVNLIKSMKIEEGEIVQACRNGFLSGEKIAELRYRNIISPENFSRLKEEGLITEQEEIGVINNLTPEEIIDELKKNGIKVIANMDEIMEKVEETMKRRKKISSNINKSRKQIIHPLVRHKLLKLLGTDIISTTPKQGFKGYQVYLIPGLDIAVMEKLFRNGRDNNPKINYGDATYVCELGKYIIVSGQSKQEIRAFMDVEGSSNGNVEIIKHTNNWGAKLIDSICKVNPKVSCRKNSKGEIEEINNSSKSTNIDISELNKIITLISKGVHSMELEEQ